MSEPTINEVDEITPQVHRKLAVRLFNSTWDLIDKSERNSDEEAMMINGAHASLYHWSQAGKPENLSVGNWQISHVYAVLGQGQSALYHARRCLDICETHAIGEWRLAFAYEAMARAYAAQGESENCRSFRAQALAAADGIIEEGERAHFLMELEKGPWFGME